MTPIEVLQKVAEGSAVEAFLARSGEHTVLVQVSRPELAEDAELFGRFLDTSKRSTMFAHPALLAPTESRIGTDGRFLLVSAPLSGWTAFDALKATGPLATKEAVRWGRALCDALSFLHQRGLVHGHLSPRNVFLEGHPLEPTVKLLDMGLLLFRAGRSLKTPVNVTLVPAEYLSPERVTGQRASVASDVYGLGVLLYELLTGAPPFRRAKDEDTRRAHLAEPVPALPSALSAWQPFFSLALAKDADARFASAAKARAALEAVLSNTTGVLPVVQGQPLVTVPKVKPQALVLPEPVKQPSAVEVGDEEIVDIVTSFDGDPQPGDVLGNYRLGACVGEGGMGKVFKATHRSLGKQVAIKVLPAELSRKQSLVKRFVQEAQTVNRVKHPNIVEVYDLFHETLPGGDLVYFVMELIEGRSLREVGREKPVELPRALNLVRQAAQALHAAHQVGVVHRDIKPDNIIVAATTEGEIAKVLDFGVARIRSETQDASRMTSAGQVVGTPLWMAPEQVMGLDVDQRGDVYALATVLYVLLERRFPFDGSTTQDMVMARLSKTARELSPRTFLGEAVPPELRTLVARCLAREPADRPQSMGEVVEALLKLEAKFALGLLDADAHPELARALPTPMPTPLPMPVPAPARRRWLWPAVAVAAVAAAAALGVFVVRPAVVPAAAVPQPPAQVAPAPAPGSVLLDVVVTSRPPGAAVSRRDTGEPLGFTPLTLKLERGKELVLDVTAPDYEPAARSVRPSADGALEIVLTKSKRRRAPVRDGVIDPFSP